MRIRFVIVATELATYPDLTVACGRVEVDPWDGVAMHALCRAADPQSAVEWLRYAAGLLARPGTAVIVFPGRDPLPLLRARAARPAAGGARAGGWDAVRGLPWAPPRPGGGCRPRAASSTRTFPAIVVTGPRQSGKTMLVRHLFPDHTYCSLDDPLNADQARRDPSLLFTRFPPPAVLDEIQYAPELLRAVKRDVDAHRTRPGRWIITGSQLFPLIQGVTESLAGRAATTSLLSFSLREIASHPNGDRSVQAALAEAGQGEPTAVLLERLLRGGYPEPALRADVDARLWHASYVQTYLERDVRTLRAVGDLADFQRFLLALAARTGGLVNFEDLGRDLGVTGKTVKAWVSVLEASGQVLTLKPHHENLGKRLVKRPKIYLLDTGTLAFLLGVDRPEQLLVGPAAGHVFEAAVLGHLFVHRGPPSRLAFWRTAAGHEVDFVIDDGATLVPIEAKLTASPSGRDAVGIEEFQRLLGRRAGHGLVVCLCRERIPLSRHVDAVPLGSF